MISALQKFVNVDGALGRKVMPFPHDEAHKSDVATFDKMTAADRLVQIKGELSSQEYGCLKGWLLLCSGSTLDTMSFYEFLHWWALSGYSYEGCIEYLIKYKFRGGQSSFAIKFWKEALSTNNLSYRFNCPIVSVKDSSDGVEVMSVNGHSFRGLKAISTVPLNVLSTIAFDPPLSQLKVKAISTGHLNQCVKVHAEVSNKELRSWSSIDPQSKLLYAFGDGTTPAGNTHIVAFGANETHLDPEKDVDVTKKILTDLTDMNIERLVSSFVTWISFLDFADNFCNRYSIIGLLTLMRREPGSSLGKNSSRITLRHCGKGMGTFSSRVLIGRWGGGVSLTVPLRKALELREMCRWILGPGEAFD